jgi:glycerophosphoryl diester phosphodiesterase
MFILLRNSLLDFRSTYKKHLSFEFIYMFITSFMFIPILTYISNKMIRAMGSSSVLNSEVFKIGLSYSGVIGILVICFLSVFILFIEFGVIIILAQKKYFHKPILISEAFISTIRKTHKLFGLGLIQFMFFLLFIIPLVDSTLSSVVFESINIPIFLTSRIYDSYIFLTVYSVIFLLVIYLILRWIFTLHFVIIEGKSIRKAIRRSLELTKHHKINILIHLLLLNIIIYIVGFIIISGITYVASLMEATMIRYLIENYLITFSSFLTLVFSLLLTPINIIFLTRLFYRYKMDQGDVIEDELKTNQSKRLNTLENKSFGFFRKRKYLLLSILMVYMTSLFLMNYFINDNIVYLKWSVAIAGHRGDMYNAPENSLSSVRSAIDKGVDAVEVDVQITKDGVLVLNHDITLRRVAGVPDQVMELTYEEISRLEIGSHFSDEFTGEKIPTLEEVLQVIKEEEGAVKLIIEIKPYGPSEEMASKVAGLIETYEMEEDCYIQSFDRDVLQHIRQINPFIKIGQIMYFAAGNLASLDVDFYTINQSMLSENFILNARKNEREVWVWTVNIERNIKEVLKYDVNGIITDFPEKVQNHIGLKN